ncbi:MAG: hypothetical protein KKE23_03105, partial [Nanoarchaeota archaeon]|nr:hypothetical protein [Nanoarchaeota archaeon]
NASDSFAPSTANTLDSFQIRVSAYDDLNITEIGYNIKNSSGVIVRSNSTMCNTKNCSSNFIVSPLTQGFYNLTLYAVDNTSIRTEVKSTLDVYSKWTNQYDLVSGFNLISIPVIPDNTSVRAVFQGLVGNSTVEMNLTEIYTYQNNKWLVFYADENIPRGDSGFDAIEPGKGYWVKMRNASAINISGTNTIISTITPGGIVPVVDLTAGWNLIGVHSLTDVDGNNYLGGISGKYTSLLECDNLGNTNQIQPIALGAGPRLEPNKGYWIYMTEAASFFP